MLTSFIRQRTLNIPLPKRTIFLQSIYINVQDVYTF